MKSVQLLRDEEKNLMRAVSLNTISCAYTRYTAALMRFSFYELSLWAKYFYPRWGKLQGTTQDAVSTILRTKKHFFPAQQFYF